MATLASQAANEDGLTVAETAAAGGGDQFTNTGIEFLLVNNESGGAITVTITAQDTSTTTGGFGILTKDDRVISVGAGAIEIIGKFAKSAYNDSSNFVQVTYSGVTSLTVAVIHFTS